MVSAQMTLTISNPIQTVAPGGTFTLMGTFTNTSTTDTLEITGGQINDPFFMMPAFVQLPNQGTTLFTDYIINNATIVPFGPGATYTGPIMSFTVDPSATPGTYGQIAGLAYLIFNIQNLSTPGNITLLDGPTSGTSITVVPEPSTGALLASAIGGLSLASRRRKALAKLAD